MARDAVPPPPTLQQVSGFDGKASLGWSKWFNAIRRHANATAGRIFLACKVSFAGRATNGACTVLDGDSYNLASIERVGVGVYEGVLTQQTAWGDDLLGNAWPVINYSLSPSGDSETFQLEWSLVDAATWRLSVYDVTQGAVVSVDRALYDPDESGDSITIAIHSTLSTELPPA